MKAIEGSRAHCRLLKEVDLYYFICIQIQKTVCLYKFVTMILLKTYWRSSWWKKHKQITPCETASYLHMPCKIFQMTWKWGKTKVLTCTICDKTIKIFYLCVNILWFFMKPVQICDYDTHEDLLKKFMMEKTQTNHAM